MLVEQTPFPGLLLITPKVYEDERGYFLEPYRSTRYHDSGITVSFPQDNFSHSRRNVLRGLHYEVRNPQAQLVFVSHGEVFDVAVDLRPGSPTFGRSHCTTLSSDNRRQLFHPPGFAHGYVVLSDVANVHYKVSRIYDPSDEETLLWNDADLAIAWPVADPLVSAKDSLGRSFRDLSADALPQVNWRDSL